MSETTTQTTNNPSLTLELSLQEVNVIIAALSEIPFKAADPVMKKLIPQAEGQLKSMQVAPEAAPQAE